VGVTVRARTGPAGWGKLSRHLVHGKCSCIGSLQHHQRMREYLQEPVGAATHMCYQQDLLFENLGACRQTQLWLSL
jgi:hypothetical protein